MDDFKDKGTSVALRSTYGQFYRLCASTQRRRRITVMSCLLSLFVFLLLTCSSGHKHASNKGFVSPPLHTAEQAQSHLHIPRDPKPIKHTKISSRQPARDTLTVATEDPNLRHQRFARRATAPSLTAAAWKDESSQFRSLHQRRSYRRRIIGEEIVHSVKGYLHCAKGADELRPVTCAGRNGVGIESKEPGPRHPGLGITLLDALDTLWLVGDQAREVLDQALDLVVNASNFDVDVDVSQFEMMIRGVGGLLAAHELFDGKEPRLLEKATSLANRLLKAYQTKSGVPDAFVNLRHGNHSNPPWHETSVVLAEFGTNMLELRTLSWHTKDDQYAAKAAEMNSFISRRCPRDGLCPIFYNTFKKQWFGDPSVGGLGDSYYEYLLKQYLHSGETDLPNLGRFLKAAESILARVAWRDSQGCLPRGPAKECVLLASLKGGERSYVMDHLSCFLGGLLQLAADSITFASPATQDAATHDGVDLSQLKEQLVPSAQGIGEACYAMSRMTPTGLAPEISRWDGQQGTSLKPDFGPQPYLLRPEALETFFYLHRAVGEDELEHRESLWEQRAWQLFLDIRRHCRVQHGYSGVVDVSVKEDSEVENDDWMPSYWIAETLKYLLLIFTERSHEKYVSLSEWVLTTEAHLLRIRPDLMDRVGSVF